MKSYWHAFLLWTLLALSPVSAVIPVSGLMVERREELRRLDEERETLERTTETFAGELERARAVAAPYQEFVEAWGEHVTEWEPGRFFQRVDQLAFGLGLATGNKGTTQQGGGSQGRRAVVVTVTLTGDYASMIRFLSKIPSEFPLIRSDLMRLQPGPGESIELQMQCTLP